MGGNSGALYDQDAFLFDDSTGELTRNPDYPGVNALFALPVDKSKADPQAAARCLHKLEESFHTPVRPDGRACNCREQLFGELSGRPEHGRVHFKQGRNRYLFHV